VIYYKNYPSDWQIFLIGDEDESIYVGSSSQRPDYNRLDSVLASNGVGRKYSRALGMESGELTQDSIVEFYSDE